MKEKNNSYQDIVCRLIVQAREGSQVAFNELLRIYEPLFRSLLTKPDIEELNAQDIEDLRQELTVIFYHSILSYEVEQSEVRFGLYAKICMTNALITQLRKLRKRKTSISLDGDDDEILSEMLGKTQSPSDEVVSRETMETLNKKIESVLSSLEKKVWQLYLTGNSVKTIAVSIGKSEKSIENAIFRLRRKLKDLFESENIIYKLK